MQFCPRDADVLVKPEAFFKPVIEPFHPLLRRAKIFQFHLLELARAEREIARIYFVSESFADLRDPEWQLLARDFENIFELNENRLRRLRAEICNRAFVRCGADMRLEHQIELARFG